MDEEIKELLQNTKLLYSAAAFLSILFAVACVDIYRSIENNKNVDDISNIKIDLDNYNYSSEGIYLNYPNKTIFEVVK